MPGEQRPQTPMSDMTHNYQGPVQVEDLTHIEEGQPVLSNKGKREHLIHAAERSTNNDKVIEEPVGLNDTIQSWKPCNERSSKVMEDWQQISSRNFPWDTFIPHQLIMITTMIASHKALPQASNNTLIGFSGDRSYLEALVDLELTNSDPKAEHGSIDHQVSGRVPKKCREATLWKERSSSIQISQTSYHDWSLTSASVDMVFDDAFGGVGDEEVVVGEGVVVTSLSLDMLINSCLGGIMVSLIFLEELDEEALVEFMVEWCEEDEDDDRSGKDDLFN
ncbi:hypothetical protein Tco_0102691 [Tanacetum coccineum]